jgi:DNA polymerase-3 subunit gamma/tau
MSEVLYRKYRPQTFDDVIGQDDVVSILKKSIKDKQIGHAYLFSGGRGTGKTTVARIFAAAIGTAPADLYEIDAASNRGVDEIRELREAVRTAPFQSPYKVYIIDEAHMLTKEAFNALLKTLEEPPAHAVFILATTDRDKLPDTVVSRTQAFRFHQPSIEVLKQFAIDVAKKEGHKLSGPGAEIVALFGDGSFRDTLSVLEKVLISAGDKKELPLEEIERVVGAPRGSLVNQVLEAIATGSTELGIRAIREAEREHVDMKMFAQLILEKMRAVLTVRYAPSAAEELEDEFIPDDLALIKKYAADKDKRINSHTLDRFLEAYGNLGYAVIPALPLELALIRSNGE